LVLLLSLSSGLAAYLIIYIVMKTREEMRQKREKEDKRMKEMEGKVKIILKELEIEANFTLKFAFMKYQNKQVQNKDRKRQ